MSTELQLLTHKLALQTIIDRTLLQFNDIPSIEYELCDIHDTMNIIDTIGSDTLIYLLNTDFTDKNYWPWKNNLIETLQFYLKDFKFTNSTYKKMTLMNTDEYKGVNKYKAILVNILKELVEYEIEFKKDNTWIFQRNKARIIGDLIPYNIIPYVVQQQLSEKAYMRAIIATLAEKDRLKIKLLDLISSSDNLQTAINSAGYREKYEIQRIIKGNDDIMKDG